MHKPYAAFGGLCLRSPTGGVPSVIATRIVATRSFGRRGGRLQNERQEVLRGHRAPFRDAPRHVDFAASAVRLDAGTTKNGEGRVFPVTQELRALLEAQRDTRGSSNESKAIMPHVFHRKGKPSKTFRNPQACFPTA